MFRSLPWSLDDIADEYHLAAKCSGSLRDGGMEVLVRRIVKLALLGILIVTSLALIIPGSIGGVVMFLFFPDTKGIPLEEVAAIFGDADEVAVYERELDFDATTHSVIASAGQSEKNGEPGHVESKV
jgi:hypothetical protein